MGMNPKRAVGQYSTLGVSQRGLFTVSDAYGAPTAAMDPLGIATSAMGAPASSYGAAKVTPIPPTLRGTASAPAGVSQIPVVGPILTNIPGGSAVQLLVFAVIAFIALRWVIREAE